MFTFGSKDKIIEKARKLFLNGKPDKAIETLESAITNEPSDLPVILEIMHIYSQINKFKELIVWAKKGETISKDAKEHILKETEDIFYGSGKPNELFEYLIEKNVEKKDFESVWKLLENIPKDVVSSIVNKEKLILDNIKKKESLSVRDKIHYYMLAVCNEVLDLKTSMMFFEEIYNKFPEEEEVIYNELERLNRIIFGDPNIQFYLAKALLKRKNFERGIELIRRAIERDKSILKDVILLVENHKNQNTIELLCDLYILDGDKDKALNTIKEFKGKEAVKKYEELAKSNPNNPEVLLSLTDAYINNERYGDAINILKNIMEINITYLDKERLKVIIDNVKDNSDALFSAAEILIQIKEPKIAFDAVKNAFSISPTSEDDTLSFIRKIEEEFPEFLEPKILKAQILGRKKEFDEAIKEIEKLLEKEDNVKIAKELLYNIYKENPENLKSAILYAIVNLNENFEKSSDTLNKLIKEDPNSIPYILKQLDTWIRNKKEYLPYVIKVYENFEKKSFPPFVLNFAIAEAYFLLGDYEKAKSNYLVAIKESPDKAGFIFKTIRAHPESKENYFLLIELLTVLNKFSIVEELINVVIEKYPDITNNLVTLLLTSISKVGKNPGIYKAVVKLLSEQDYLDEVIEYASKAIGILDEKDCGHIFFYLASALGEKGSYDESIKYFKKAATVEPNLTEKIIEKLEHFYKNGIQNAEMLLFLFKLYRDKKDIKNAGQILFNAYRINPTLLKEIVDNFSKLIEVSPIDASLHLRLGQILIENGDEKGFDHLEKAIRFDKSSVNYVINALDSANGKNVKTKAFIFKTKLLKSLKKYDEIINTLLYIYKNLPEYKDDAIKEIVDVVNFVDIDEEIYKELLDIFKDEKRTRNIIELSESFTTKHPDKSEFVLKNLDEIFKDSYSIPLLFLKAKILKKLKKYDDMAYILREIFEKDNNSAETIVNMIDFVSDNANKLLADCFIFLKKPKSAYNLIKNLKHKEKIDYLEKIVNITEDDELKRELAEIYIIEGKNEDAINILKSLKSKSEIDSIMLYFAGEDVYIPIDKFITLKRELMLKKLEYTDDLDEKFNISLKLRLLDKAKGLLQFFPKEKRLIKLAWIELYEGRFYNSINIVKGIDDMEAKRIILIASSRLGFEKVARKYAAVLKYEIDNFNIQNLKNGIFKVFWR